MCSDINAFLDGNTDIINYKEKIHIKTIIIEISFIQSSNIKFKFINSYNGEAYKK